MAGSAGVLSATARLHTAFTKPLHQRCQEITKIIDETSTKELHSVLPLLLENMFGFSNQMGWGLGRLTKNHQHDFAVLRHFLAPQGPLLNLIHKLLLDPYCRYEFPMACLPYPSRHTLEEGGMCAFYATKVQFHPGHGRPFNILSLNSFELYFFHFAYVLVNPNSQKMSAWSSPSDALYPVLLEDYFNYYLPLEGRKVPPMPHVAAPVRSPISQQSPLQRSQNTSSPSTTPNRVPFSLLRTSLHQRTPLSPHQVAGQSTDPVEQETWRSQTLIEICVEFWLNQNTLENNKSASAFSQHVTPYGGSGPGQGNLSKIDPYYYIMCESFLPSSDHVRVVRMFIKHLHLFTATARVEVISSPYSTQIVTPLDELRRQVWPQFAQKKLYAFLRHGFERWPLDSSFRLMLETWLSFIQPWRYTNPAQQYQRDRDAEKDKTVDDKWFPFIGDNLLFYTVLLQEFLPRVFRMDLSAPKNAYMLFRVSKVFNLTNLASLLRDAESTLFEPVQRAPVSRTMDLGGSYLSPSLSSRVASLNLQLTELEAPGFTYKPFFSDITVKQIEQILLTITQAKVSAQSAQNKTDSNGGSWWSWLFGSAVDYNTHSYASYDYYDDLGVGDNKRLEAHLDQATANLCEIFEIPMPQDIQNMPWGHLNTSTTPESLSPDHLDTEDGPALTPLGRYQMMNGLRHFDVQLRGDPETQRIRSYECAFLVRLLYQISVFLNDKYAQEIETLYLREDFLGRLASQYLTVPQSTRSPPRHGRAVASPRTREARALMSRPRISLRWLASYQNLAYVMLFYLATYFWLGLGGVGGIMLLIVAGLMYGIFMALFAPHPRAKKD